jgi:hypothetical protein
MTVQFKASHNDLLLMSQIANRYLKRFPNFGKKLDVMMDLEAVISNGCPLKLSDLLAADDFNFFHDVCGIRDHLDRETGKLKDQFSPRYELRNLAEQVGAFR